MYYYSQHVRRKKAGPTFIRNILKKQAAGMLNMYNKRRSRNEVCWIKSNILQTLSVALI